MTTPAMTTPSMTALVSHPVRGLRGATPVPGDKSISHRALILGACAVGETRIEGLLDAEDVRATAAALKALHVTIDQEASTIWRVHGRGVGGLSEPDRVLDLGNSGTGARLLMGVVATHPFTTFFTGDRSLNSRPMQRIIAPLTEMGARFTARSGGRLPLAVIGATDPMPMDYAMTVPSAQVKTAVLLAALNTPGTTTIIEPEASRDHTEMMLADFGAAIDVEALAGGGRRISLTGEPELYGRSVTVPGDISSAAFAIVAALVTDGSSLTIKGVGVNPLRTGLLETLAEMGAAVSVRDAGLAGREPIADLVIRSCPLQGVRVPGSRVPSMIDEIPVLAVAAACANGETRMEGLGELRVKESDRLAAIARGLAQCGVAVEHGQDWIVIHGAGGSPPGDARISVALDHRIAMAFLVLGCASRKPVAIDDAAAIATSFPQFVALMNRLGADIRRG
jgi:3-phosphoshikimate 1-carboxyvinyltransferase